MLVMLHRYLALWLTALAAPALAQTNGSPPAAFYGGQPDSLATLPPPGSTFRLQGRAQPVQPFLTIQDQLRTVAGVQMTPYDGSSGSAVRIWGGSVAQGKSQPLYMPKYDN